MSIIHVNQIQSKIKDLFEGKIDLNGIKDKDPEKEVKFLSRALTAYAIYNHSSCTVEEAASAVIDSGDDNGIDGVFYSTPSKELIIVQSKWIKNGSGEPESGEILKFCTGIEHLMNLDFDRFNSKVAKRQAEIQAAISAFDTKYVVILAYTGNKGLARHGQGYINDLLSKLNDAGEGIIEDIVSFEKYDQSKIYSSLSNGLLSDPINLEIGLHQWGKYTDPFGAYFGYVSGEDLALLWEKHRRKLFHKNIRNVLGKTDVNEELTGTIQNNPEKFWYFNNGITIISESIKKSMTGGSSKEIGIFNLVNASIVNGAQTISSIGDAALKFPEQVKKIFVLARCISLEDAQEEFGNEVTRANNRQNRIENRDFVSQDPQQSRLREELAHDDFSYVIVRSDQFSKSLTSFDVEEATLCLACASGLVSLAVQAKREVGKFYENLEKGIYKQIYNASVTSRYVANCILINREIEKLIEGKTKSIEKRSGKEYGILIHGNRMISLLVFKMISISTTEIMRIDELKLSEIFVSVLEKVTNIIATNFSENVLATLFKNKSKCEELEKLCS